MYSQPQSNRSADGTASHPGVLGLHRATGQLLVVLYSQPQSNRRAAGTSATLGSWVYTEQQDGCWYISHPGVLGLHRATGEPLLQPATLGSWVYTEQQDGCWYSQPPWGPGSTQSNRTAADTASHPGVLGLHRATGQLLVQPATLESWVYTEQQDGCWYSQPPWGLGSTQSNRTAAGTASQHGVLGPPWSPGSTQSNRRADGTASHPKGPGSTQSNRSADGTASHPGVLGLHRAKGQLLVTGG